MRYPALAGVLLLMAPAVSAQEQVFYDWTLGQLLQKEYEIKAMSDGNYVLQKEKRAFICSIKMAIPVGYDFNLRNRENWPDWFEKMYGAGGVRGQNYKMPCWELSE